MARPIEVRDLEFRYRGGSRAVLSNVTFSLERGDRCLLVGRNGAGKTTLLRVLAGKHLVAEGAALVLGRPAFHDTSLAGRVAFVGGPFPFHVDVTVAEIVSHTPGEPGRRARLIEIFGIDETWHMDRVSDGQRRRVQLLLGLIHPAEVILLDEATSDLDLVARADLLEFLREESVGRGAVVIDATHVLDGLEDWATHVGLLEDGRLVRLEPLSALSELRADSRPTPDSALGALVLSWLRPSAGER
jgi:CCR4-NOT complex subunit CAF16